RPGYTGKGDIATLPSLALFLGLASTVLMPAGNALSRVWERQCDRFALDMTRQPDAFIGVMRKLAAQNLADPAPSALIEALLYTHPSIGNRIRMALRWEALNAERAE
ncbi:MAG TPA: M48 family metalloprotease, partial [Armatimonadota bacterium]|nr:M48 family metalloprotease [Armatimonadota bacterium]